MNCDLPIAVFDSGIGGVTVLRELVRLMPEENFIFYADTAHNPYGTKTTGQVRDFVFDAVTSLKDEGIKAVVIACNTATGAAAKELRDAFDFPIIGIEPAIKTAADLYEHPSVLVMATPLTLKQEKFLDLKRRFDESEEITLLPCDRLVELIEGGHTDDGELFAYLDELFSPLGDKKFDAVVLGCTHYPLVREAIRRKTGCDAIFDGSIGVANQTKRRLIEAGIKRDAALKGSVTVRNSANDEKVNQTVLKYLDMK